MNPDKPWWWAFDPRRSLAARIGGIFAVGGVVIVLLLANVTEEFLRGHLETRAKADFENVASQLALKLDRDLAERAAEIQRLAAHELLMFPSGSLAARRELLEKNLQALNLAWLGLTDAAGVVVVASGGHLEGSSMASEAWFVNGQRELHVGRVLANPELRTAIEDGSRFLAFAAPVKGADGRVVGVLGAQQFWNWGYDAQTSPLPRTAARVGLVGPG
jgi:hypothetical protein